MRKIGVILVIALMACVACAMPKEDRFEKFREIAERVEREREAESEHTQEEAVQNENTDVKTEAEKPEWKEEVNTGYVSFYDGELGTAGSLKGNTLIVSIFASDRSTSWNFQNRECQDTRDETLKNLSIATEWLSKQASQYQTSATFVYDWKVNPDLKYETTFQENLITPGGEMYNLQKSYIENHVRTSELKNKYQADNVIYFFFFNTDYKNQVNPWTIGYSVSKSYKTEFINMYIKFDESYIAPPSTYAHEMLHAFGAHDLYYKNEAISQAYVDYCTKQGSNDIMYTVVMGDEITNEFTELDAYYVGLVDSSDEAVKWKLGKSEHK